jgi:hypothetical protein
MVVYTLIYCLPVVLSACSLVLETIPQHEKFRPSSPEHMRFKRVSTQELPHISSFRQNSDEMLRICA